MPEKKEATANGRLGSRPVGGSLIGELMGELGCYVAETPVLWTKRFEAITGIMA